MFKEYEKQYESLYSNKERKKKVINIDDVSIYKNNYGDLSSYISAFREEARKTDLDIFDHIVKITWLSRKFCYGDNRRKKSGRNGIYLDRAFSLFLKNYVNFDLRFSLPTSSYSKIVSYLDEFFPNFEEGNPFEEEYAYPFKHVPLCSLAFIYQMEERMDLLKISEARQLSHAEFLDYVLNYINCLNDEIGENKYECILNFYCPNYIKNMFNDKNRCQKKKGKRKKSR